MIQVKRIFPECNADTLLVKLILQRGNPVHYEGIPNVATALKKFPNDTAFIIGLVDDDKFKTLPSFIKEFSEIPDNEYLSAHGLQYDGVPHDLPLFIQNHRQLISQQNLIILKHPGTQKYLIKLKPAFEKWIISVGESCGITLGESEYEGNFMRFKDEAKDDEVYNNKNVKKFINSIVIADPPAIQTLRFWFQKVFVP